jgi:hypothetical protein
MNEERSKVMRILRQPFPVGLHIIKKSKVAGECTIFQLFG